MTISDFLLYTLIGMLIGNAIAYIICIIFGLDY
jgi:hypothetical protein